MWIGLKLYKLSRLLTERRLSKLRIAITTGFVSAVNDLGRKIVGHFNLANGIISLLHILPSSKLKAMELLTVLLMAFVPSELSRPP